MNQTPNVNRIVKHRRENAECMKLKSAVWFRNTSSKRWLRKQHAGVMHPSWLPRIFKTAFSDLRARY
jgi:hypothetical protein